MNYQHLVEVLSYKFSNKELNNLHDNFYASNQWPLVYVLSDSRKKLAYVGETTNTLTRMKAHLKHSNKCRLTTVHLIISERFNKSATLDIESKLIRYIYADGVFSLINGNLGMVDHNYYQKDDFYTQIFTTTWDKLRSAGVVKHSLEFIDNSDLFKYSPYKSLSFNQRQNLLGIIYALLDEKVSDVVIQGGAGTGKSVLAIFLFKLLHCDDNSMSFRDFSTEENEFRGLLEKFKQRFYKPSMALVVPMSSFRNTLKKAFKQVSGLKANMVISPSELAKNKYDIVLVDEAHRLRKRVNLGAYYRKFDETCEALEFDKASSSELDWVCKQANKAVFFYDKSQSIKPSDVNPEDFDRLKTQNSTLLQTLASQFRVRGGNGYINFVDCLLQVGLKGEEIFKSKQYEFVLYEKIEDMVSIINMKNEQFGLSRLIAGYSWPWISQKKANLFDINIENLQFRWNSTSLDWINSKNSVSEVGCIHTTQGYDLNYAGIIFGEEIDYDKSLNQIVVYKDRYFDRNGKNTIKNSYELKQYILNIYKTIMSRAIKGTFVYACNKNMREYLAKHIPTYESGVKRNKEIIDLKPYINAVPFFDLQAAAGGFSELQHVEQKEWIFASPDIQLNKDFFACKVVGESMNKLIPNGSTCLFRLERGGTRSGKIVLVELRDIIDDDSGCNYTVKEYESFKVEMEDGWRHNKIILKPISYDQSYKIIEITEDKSSNYRVIAEFVKVL